MWPFSDDVLDALGRMTKTGTVLGEVLAERFAQHEKWGVQSWPNGTGGEQARILADGARALTDRAAKDGTLTYRNILEEEVYEAFAESDPEKLKVELVQVAAVACAWAEKLDREKE